MNVENQFLQLMNNPKMLHAIKEVVVNVNLTRAITALNYQPAPDVEWLKTDFILSLDRAVFPSIQHDVFKYYKTLNTGIPMIVRPDILKKGSKDKDWIPYHPEKDGYVPFGLYCNYRPGVLVIEQSDNLVIDLDKNYEKPSEICQFPELNEDEISFRTVDVRIGSDHYDFGGKPKYTAAVSEDGIYRCNLWKDKEVKQQAEGQVLIFSGATAKKQALPTSGACDRIMPGVGSESAISVVVNHGTQVHTPLITHSYEKSKSSKLLFGALAVGAAAVFAFKLLTRKK